MTPELAQATLGFLASADLKGAQVNLFVACCQALQEIARPSQPPPPAQTEVEQNDPVS